MIDKNKTKILLIDDNPKNLQIAMNILSSEGYKLIYAKDSEKGLYLAQNDDFDLILLDVLMPGIDGYTICTKLKNNPKTQDIPIIFLTVKDEEQDIIKGFECGGVDYVTKPFQVAVLLKRVETHLTLAQQTKKLKQLNQDLNRQVHDQVEKIRLKDQILFQQSKMVSMGEMIANIAHQWRQPLTAISAALVGIKTKVHLKKFDLKTEKGSKAFEDYLTKKFDDIQEYIDTLSTTVDDFRYFFRPKKDKEHFELQHIVDKSIKLLEEGIDMSSIKIIKEIEPITMIGLKNELSQVLINLLKNAYDAFENKSNQNAKEIKIKAANIDKTIHIYIQDNAGGIDTEVLPKIFEPYFTTKHQSNGTGLGLYMVSEIIQKHMKGHIYVENISYTIDNLTYKGVQFHIEIQGGV